MVLGYRDTLPVTMDEMLRPDPRGGARRALAAMVIGDMPFMSYNTDVADAVPQRRPLRARRAADRASSSRAGAARGGRRCGRMVRGRIPVDRAPGPDARRPRSMIGGYTLPGARRRRRRALILDDARRLEEAGVLRCWCWRASRPSWPRRWRSASRIPIIGIGAGARRRRPGAGAARHARVPRHRGRPALRQALRRPGRPRGRGGAGLLRGGPLGGVPGGGAQLRRSRTTSGRRSSASCGAGATTQPARPRAGGRGAASRHSVTQYAVPASAEAGQHIDQVVLAGQRGRSHRRRARRGGGPAAGRRTAADRPAAPSHSARTGSS
ncbi:MAG: 3-methyl-2-oxobutanoate hydroxymethyltransferase [Marinilabiliales bacterium]|nr:3-methyl-2-oxobutanoate hydroxymethyltransferase [Marinilabiliales bacterium]